MVGDLYDCGCGDDPDWYGDDPDWYGDDPDWYACGDGGDDDPYRIRIWSWIRVGVKGSIAVSNTRDE